jgi:hypothetical protein
MWVALLAYDFPNQKASGLSKSQLQKSYLDLAESGSQPEPEPEPEAERNEVGEDNSWLEEF